MGKMPLTSLIGACSIGMLLTGCNCCKQNTNPPYAGGRADRGMGLLSPGKASNSSSADLAASAGAPVNPPASPSSTGAAPITDPLATSGTNANPNFGMNSGSMVIPGNSGGMPAMGGASSLPTSPAPGTPVSMGTTSLGGQLSPTGSSLSPMMTSAAGSSRLSSPAIQQAGLQGDSSSQVTNASYRPIDPDSTPSLPMTGPNSAMSIPPPPPIKSTYPAPTSSTAKSGTAKSKTSSASTWIEQKSSPPIPSSGGSQDPYNTLPPSVKAASSSLSGPGALPPPSPSSSSPSSLSGPGALPPPSPSSGSPSSLPSYLQ